MLWIWRNGQGNPLDLFYSIGGRVSILITTKSHNDCKIVQNTQTDLPEKGSVNAAKENKKGVLQIFATPPE
jgi:hypothetical protein